MRLTIRLSLMLGAVIALVMALDCAWRAHRAVEASRDKFVERAAHQGRTLANAASAVWARRGVAAAQGMVIELAPELTVRTRWLPLQAEPPLDFAGEPSEWAALRGGGALPPRASADEDWTVMYTPVEGRDGEPGAVLEVARFRHLERAEFWRIVREQAALLGFELLALGLAVFFTVRREIARPLRRLTELARRIGDSDFSARVLTRRDDEVGRLARQMNEAAEQLQQARAAAADAARAELLAMRELRHAERLKTVGQLGSGIAHELGTPLNVVIGRAKMIHKGYVEGDALRESAEVIVQQGERMTSLIHNLLTFARRRPSTPEPVDLEAIVQDTCELLNPLVKKRQVAVYADVPALRVRGDAGNLQQVLTNLIMNAADANARRVDITGDRSGDDVVLEIVDDGDGMSQAVADQVFDPFFTTKGVDEGTGLGLSITFGIVQDHHGDIRVTSAEGEGTTFTITLPSLT